MRVPTGEMYGRLLDFVRRLAARFTLVLSGSGDKSIHPLQLLAALDMHLVEKIETSDWRNTSIGIRRIALPMW